MRILLKNFTVVAVAVGLVLGVLVGFLLGNLPLGMILMVGIAVGAVALLDELEVDPAALATGRPLARTRLGARRREAVTPVATPRDEAGSPTRVAGAPASPQPASPGPAPSAPSSPRPAGSAAGARPPAPAPTSTPTDPTPTDPTPTDPTPNDPTTTAPAPAGGAAVAGEGVAGARTVVLVAAVGQQASEPARAREFYTSPLFRLSLDYAETLAADDIYILSAQHYLLRPGDEVAPEGSLSAMKADELKAWSDEVVRRLREVADLGRDRFVVLAAHKYRKHLVADLKHVELPTEGLSLGEQLDFLKARVGG